MPGDRLDRMGFFDRLKSGLTRTTEQIAKRFDELVGAADTPEHRSRPIDVDTAEALEELLISADVGVAATDGSWRRSAAVRGAARACARWCKPEIRAIFADTDRPVAAGHATRRPDRRRQRHRQDDDLGKLANLARSSGQQPLICAADTFRAAAVDQLQIWADRAGVEMIRASEGADPAAVVFDAIVGRQGPRPRARCWSTPPAACIRAPT